MKDKIIGRDVKQTKLADDECIVLYKKGSGGEIIDIKHSIMSIVDEENRFNGSFKSSYVLNVLSGWAKSYTSLKNQCRIKPVIRKISEVRHIINPKSVQ